MYQSPIELILKHIVEEREDGLYHNLVYHYGVDVDKEELVKALQYDRDQYEKGYQDGVRNFAEYLKTHSFLCDSNDWYSFRAINVEDDLDDMVEEYLLRKHIL